MEDLGKCLQIPTFKCFREFGIVLLQHCHLVWVGPQHFPGYRAEIIISASNNDKVFTWLLQGPPHSPWPWQELRLSCLRLQTLLDSRSWCWSYYAPLSRLSARLQFQKVTHLLRGWLESVSGWSQTCRLQLLPLLHRLTKMISSRGDVK